MSIIGGVCNYSSLFMVFNHVDIWSLVHFLLPCNFFCSMFDFKEENVKTIEKKLVIHERELIYW